MLSDKIKGCLLGYAIGDALGLGTELMSRQEVAVRYPEGLTDFHQFIKDAHRSQWTPGHPTNDTTMMLMTAESIIDSKGINNDDFCRRLKTWFDDEHPIDISSNLRWVLSSENYLKDPRGNARYVFVQHDAVLSRNDSLGRALIIGLWPEFDENQLIDHITLTHAHPMTLVSSCIIATTAHNLLWHDRMPDIDTLKDISSRYDIPAHDRHNLDIFFDIIFNGRLEEFELDDEESASSAVKAMAAALWILVHHDKAEEGLYNIVAQGGDADSVSALAIGLIGLRDGIRDLPIHLIDKLKGKERIMEIAGHLSEVLASAANK